MDVPAGNTISLPKGVLQAWCNLSKTPLRVLEILTPAFEELCVEIAEGEVDPTAVSDRSVISDKYGIRLVGQMLLNTNVQAHPNPQAGKSVSG